MFSNPQWSGIFQYLFPSLSFSTNCDNCQLVKCSFCFPMATDSCPKWWDFHIDNWKVSQITAKSTWSLISHLNIQKEFFFILTCWKKVIYIPHNWWHDDSQAKHRRFERFNKLSFPGNGKAMYFGRFEWFA